MPKVLKIAYPKNCSGCELCVLEAQRQLGKFGMEGSPIRIFRKGTGFAIEIDPRINNLDLDKIRTVCPKANFYIEDANSDELLG